MDANTLLRTQIASRLICESRQIAIGPTGPTGGTATIPGALKGFTLFLDYTSTNTISRVYVPPGLFTANPVLALGGVFTSNVGTDLVFQGLTPGVVNLELRNTTHSFVCSMGGSSYNVAGEWNPIAGRNISLTAINYAITSTNAITLKNLSLGNFNGGNFSTRPTTGIAAGFLVTITLFYV